MPAPRRTRERGSVPWAEPHREHTVLPEIFFKSGRGSATAPKKVCMSCTERATCLEWAMETGQDQFGVLGGKTAQERRKLKRDALKVAAAQQAAPMEATA